MKFLGNGRSLEKAQMMTAHESPQLAGHPSQVALPEIKTATEGAVHESPRTSKLYDRTNDQISLDEVERVVF